MISKTALYYPNYLINILIFISRIPSPLKPPSPTKSSAPQPDRSNKPADRKLSGTSFNKPINSPSDVKSPRIVLPKNYERKLHPETQRFYFVNHKDRTTSWSAPEGK